MSDRTKAVSVTDRIADGGIILLAALHTLLFAAFLATAWIMSGAAHAQDTSASTCGGENLLVQVKRDTPDVFASMEAEASSIPNGNGLLWRIEKAGIEPSYLFGTMHMTDERVVSLTPAAQSAYEGASTVVIETIDVLDPARASAAMFKDPELVWFSGDASLDDLIPAEEQAFVEEELAERGMPYAAVRKLKPWMLSAAIALPACEQERKKSGLDILDIKLAREAEAAGKPVVGLETMATQLRAMASLPDSFHVDGLIQTLKLSDQMDDIFETMISLYKDEQTGMFTPLFKYGGELVGTPEQADAYAQFEEAMINVRNEGMVLAGRPILDAGNAFIAVGALHLPGEKGLVELFRKDGYTVTRVE